MPDPEDKDDDKPDDKFVGQFNKLFHAGMGERDKRLTKSVQKMIDEGVASALAKFAESLPETLKPLLAAVQPQPAPQPDNKGGVPAEIEARINSLAGELKAAKAKADKFEQQAGEERLQRNRAEERQQLQAALTGKIKPAMLEMVTDQLHSKNIKRDPETGAVLWANGDEVLPLGEGVTAWCKSDIGKEFAPPAPAKGSGGQGPGGSVSAVGGDGKVSAEIVGGLLFGGAR